MSSEVKTLGLAAAAMGAMAAIVLTVMAVVSGFQDSFVTNIASCGRNSTGGTSGTILYTACDPGYNVAGYFNTALAIFGSFAVVVVLAIIGKVIIKLFKM